MNTLTFLFLGLLVISLGLQLWLANRHVRHVRRHQDALPEAFAKKITLDDHQKAASYTITKTNFGQLLLILEAIILLVWTLGGLLNWLDQSWRTLEWSNLWTGVAVMLSMGLISTIIDLPASLYRTFKIEEDFGFNNMTPKLFVTDFIKSFILSIAIGVPFLALILWLMEHAGEYWWLSVWAVWMGFSILMMWAYPAFIAPLFNKFQPLDNEDLKSRIERLLTNNGFSSQGIFIMDGSKRSGHGNAYFTGFGSNKRIVFFDTLLKGLEPEEVEAVLAHEVGHFKRKHIVKRMILMAILSLAGLAVLGWLMTQNWFYAGLGVTEPSTYTALILFMLIMPVFTFFLHPVMAWFSRQHEFEADDFAAQQTQANTLVQALVKLYKDNASTLTPDPLYSAFYDSHPPAPVRIKHLSAKMG